MPGSSARSAGVPNARVVPTTARIARYAPSAVTCHNTAATNAPAQSASIIAEPATIAFGLSRSFVLSLLMLAIAGGTDMVSVVIRSSLVQLATPDAMRGRVNAVENVFIGASNELGAFESGTAAALIGVVPSVVVGGVGTLAIIALWAVFFPALRRADRIGGPANATA